MTNWKATFLRVSLSMNSYDVVDWSGTYKSQMENVINAIGTYPNAYVLVALRSHPNMMKNCPNSNVLYGDDARCMPNSSDSMDDTYRALVGSFKDARSVLFAITNEPGGMSASDSEIRGVMDHAVSVIRAEEDRLGVPHHLVAVQGNQWTSRIGFYDSSPLPYDNVVYEYHSYPPEATGTYGYTQSNIPVIIGEYGPGMAGSTDDNATMSDSATLFADLEAKKISSLAWDFSPLSDCAPDLVYRNRTPITPNAWGRTVKDYLLAHAPLR